MCIRDSSKIIPIEDGMADFNGVKFPIDPMIGVIGTAPDGEDVIDGFVGAHGGNLDNKLITKGTRIDVYKRQHSYRYVDGCNEVTIAKRW